MPTIQFKGKSIIWNHHLSVPYSTLDSVEELSFQPEEAQGNMIIEGDNLYALKALLPLYAGQVNCIYIDPPYNTGTESWVYNDNVNSPLMQDWIGKVVGKDDLTRHDKWLCMMAPRLRLLHELLADDGAIFISIDKNEIHNLRFLLDEIFFENNFIGILIWRKKEGGGQTDQFFVTEHEYIVVYRKTDKFNWIDEQNDVEITEFSRTDDMGRFSITRLAKWGSAARRVDRPKMYFPLLAPDGRKVYPVAPDGSEGRWRVGAARMNDLVEDGLIHWENEDGNWIAYEKNYYEEGMKKIIKERSILYDLANTADGTNTLTELFGRKDVFENPKPIQLIKFLLEHSTTKKAVILDSFAGSGTTGHAVLELNAEDDGNRRFIMVQMTESDEASPEKNICRDITSERIRLAINAYGYSAGFEYFQLGNPIDAETLLEGQLPSTEQLGNYLHFLCLGEKNESGISQISDDLYLIGSKGIVDVYMIYSTDYNRLTRLALNLVIAEKFLTPKSGRRSIVYSPACFVDEEYLQSNMIEFVNLPYGLFRLTGNES